MYTLFFLCGLTVQAKYVRGKETACTLGRLPDYIYCDVPITPVKSPVGKPRAQIPRYRLITEGVVTTRKKPTRTFKSVFRTK